MKNLPVKTVGIIFVIAAFSAFALSDVMIKASSEQLNVLTVALYMNIFTALFLTPMVIKTGGFRNALKTKNLKIHVFRALLMLGNFLCFIYALGNMPITTFYVIIFLMPFILNIMAWIILKEKISGYRWLAILIATIGVIIALRPATVPITIPVIIAFTTSLFNAGANITIKFIDKKDHWLSYTLYLMIVQTPIIVGLMLIKDIPLVPDMGQYTIFWLMGGGFAYAFALSLLPQAIQRIDVSLVGSFVYVAFPWGIFYGYFIFQDVPDRWTLLGAVIIITSGLFLIYRERKENSK